MKSIHKILLGLCCLASSVAVADYRGLVVFGDSLSDPGNVFVVTREVSVRPYDVGNIPSAPYPVGGLTFTNGKTWIQQVSSSLNLRGGTGPALRTKAFSNYAFGSARAASSANGPFDLNVQVSRYLADTDGSADSEALYTIFLGGNDVRDALLAFNAAFEQTLQDGGTFPEALAAGQEAAELILVDAVSSIAANIITLSSAGAQNFLIPNVPNLGDLPAIKEFGPETELLATQLSIAFNLGLEDALSGIEIALPVDITRMDVFSSMSAVVNDPEAFGLINTLDACLLPEVYRGAVCRHPDDYFFWDGIHPTRVVHNLMAEDALSALE